MALSAVRLEAMVINAFHNKRYGPGGSTQHLHQEKILNGFFGQRVCVMELSPSGNALMVFSGGE